MNPYGPKKQKHKKNIYESACVEDRKKKNNFLFGFRFRLEFLFILTKDYLIRIKESSIVIYKNRKALDR